MPAALSKIERQQIVQMREQGQSFKAIAVHLNRDYKAVRQIYHRYIQDGELEPSYNNCCHSAIRKDASIYHRAIELKQRHPQWGAGLIWVELAEDFKEEELPSERTLQRWFRRGGVQKLAPDRSPHPFATRGKRAHEVWAMDAKEQVELGDGSYVSWLTVTDEGSGAILGGFLFPLPLLVRSRSDASEGRFARTDAILGSSRENTNG
jgi:hypothetical protein